VEITYLLTGIKDCICNVFHIDDVLADNLVYAVGLGQFSSPLYAIYFLPSLDWNYLLKNDCYSCKDM